VDSAGPPDAEEYIAHCLRSGKARIDFRGMAPQLTLELQYAVQCRHDQATITAPPPVVAWTITLARRAEMSSLLDHSPQWWHELAGSKQGMYQRFLEYARDAVETVHEGTGAHQSGACPCRPSSQPGPASVNGAVSVTAGFAGRAWSALELGTLSRTRLPAWGPGSDIP